ncbi:MAG: hypothetical protein WD342_02580 [Verrucomicrobiales bacterium]
MDTDSQLNEYQDASRAVRRRVGKVRFARWIRRSHWIAGVAGVLAVVVLRRIFEWRSGEWTFVLGLLALWAVAGAALAVARRPGTLDSLLLLDRKGGWKDRFSSAWLFLKRGAPDEGQRLHVSRAGELLSAAVEKFPSAMPLPRLKWTWLAPAAAVAFAALPLWRIPPDAGDLLLTSEMQDAAALQSDRLRRQADAVRGLDSLDEEEKEELERLGAEVGDVAEGLAEAEGLTAEEVLESLEGRARAAERLAEKLGLGEGGWASNEMLAEMTAHPDTADLGLAVKDKAAASAADEAMELFAVLDNPDIKQETRGRLTGALERIMQAATEVDRTKPVGERVGNASNKLLDAQPRTAAREFQELAKHFRLLDRREQDRQKLENLAASLREAGSEISGSEAEKMEKIASEKGEGRAAPEGLRSLDGDDVPEDLKNLLSPQMAESGQPNSKPGQPPTAGDGQNGPSSEPVPGTGGDSQHPGEQPPSGQQPPNLSAPTPGETPQPGGEGEGMSLGDESQDGEGQGGMLSAPVPGESEAGSAASMAGTSSGQSAQGGNEAGDGTAEMVDRESEAMKFTRDAEVVARTGEDGESTVRAVEGRARRESATRSRQEVVGDFLAVEEQALDGKSLPASRREHVLRYFSEIRRQFEQNEDTR